MHGSNLYGWSFGCSGVSANHRLGAYAASVIELHAFNRQDKRNPSNSIW